MSRVVPQIGLTGSIGSGKSAVADLFAVWGSKIVDADDFARKLLAEGTAQSRTIVERFGPQITRPDGSLDRFALRSLVFSNEAAKLELESLLHPEIRAKMLEKCAELLKTDCPSITLVIPLLFESKVPYSNLTHTVVVSADRDKCLSRASSRDGASIAITARIFDSQTATSEKEARADYVIKNNGSLEELAHNARIVFDSIHSK